MSSKQDGKYCREISAMVRFKVIDTYLLFQGGVKLNFDLQSVFVNPSKLLYSGNHITQGQSES